jgi:hypothetical protein
VLLKDVFPLEPNKALQRLTALKRHWPAMLVLKWGVRSKRWDILPLEAIGVSVEIDPTGADYLEIRDTRYSHPALDEPAEFYARSADTKDIEHFSLLENDNNVVDSDYDPIARFEREPGGRLYTPPRRSRRTAAPLRKEPTSAPAPSEKRQRTARKSGLVKTAIAGCFPKGIPGTLPNPELVQQIMNWLADYWKENGITPTAISATQVLRVSGRKR